MAAEISTRLLVYTWPSGDDPFTREQMNTSHTNMEARTATFLSGVYASRPVAGTSSTRMFYLATDQNAPNGVLYYCDGTTWVAVNSFAAPASLEPGDAEVSGTAATLARSDHQHQMLPWGEQVDLAAVSTSAAAGSSDKYARADHVHILANDSVTAGKIAAGGVSTSSQLANDVVTAGKIAAGGVSASSQLANDVVATAALAASSVTRQKIVESERTPTGGIIQFGGSSAPTGWVLCDGSTYSQTLYADLYAVLGSTYNTGGETAGFFRVPDMRGRVPVGSGSGTGLTARALGGRSGVETVTLAESQIPSHTHTITHDHPAQATGDANVGHTHLYANVAYVGTNGRFFGSATIANNQYDFATGSTGGQTVTHSHTVDILPFTGNSGSTGSSGSHDNMQPYLVVNYIIKY